MWRALKYLIAWLASTCDALRSSAASYVWLQAMHCRMLLRNEAHHYIKLTWHLYYSELSLVTFIFHIRLHFFTLIFPLGLLRKPNIIKGKLLCCFAPILCII